MKLVNKQVSLYTNIELMPLANAEHSSKSKTKMTFVKVLRSIYFYVRQTYLLYVSSLRLFCKKLLFK